MKVFFIRLILKKAFDNITGVKLYGITQAGKGWMFVIKDEVNKQEYLMTATPILSEMYVSPATADELLRMNGDK